jgi:hypothetical protein
MTTDSWRVRVTVRGAGLPVFGLATAAAFPLACLLHGVSSYVLHLPLFPDFVA